MFHSKLYFRFFILSLLFIQLNAQARSIPFGFSQKVPGILRLNGIAGGMYNGTAHHINNGDSIAITIKNTGHESTSTITLSISGSGFSDAGNTCDGAILAPGQTCIINVFYSDSGDNSGSVSVSASFGGNWSRPLYGCGASTCY